MNALVELKKRAPSAAIPAIPAVQEQQVMAESQESQESQESREVKGGCHISTSGKPASLSTLVENRKELRVHLIALSEGERMDPARIRQMQDADMDEWLGLGDGARVLLLHLLADTADRHCGRVPVSDTAPMHCRHCGPVWVHPGIIAALPNVGGWARGLGCPWCFVRSAGGPIPRPPVTCSDCQHFVPDAIDREVGLGTCRAGHGSYLPTATHGCVEFSISKPKGDFA
jgi:hypothetical protein